MEYPVKLVNYSTLDGIKMKGLLCIAKDSETTIIHVHGSCGNFYENDFIEAMSHMYPTNGINFFSTNNRGHDCIAEAYQNGKLVYLGGALEIFEECVHDIGGAIEFARSFSNRIILQGHSIGCLKVLAYLFSTNENLDFILLSPSDPYQIQTDFIAPETIDEQLVRIREAVSTDPFSLLPREEFGVRQNDSGYLIPISARTFISIFQSPLLDFLDYKKDKPYFIDSSLFVYYGGKDALWTENFNTIENYFSKRVRKLQMCYIENGDHHFHGFEEDVLARIVSWTNFQ